MSRMVLAAGLLVVSTPALGQSAEEALASAKALTGVTQSCASGGAEIVVCGSNDQRLPFPPESDGSNATSRRGEVPRASAAVIGPICRHCGSGTVDVFRAFGVLRKVVTKLADPDAELEDPAPIPTARP